jgi:hypothetical protein
MVKIVMLVLRVMPAVIGAVTLLIQCLRAGKHQWYDCYIWSNIGTCIAVMWTMPAVLTAPLPVLVLCVGKLEAFLSIALTTHCANILTIKGFIKLLGTVVHVYIPMTFSDPYFSSYWLAGTQVVLQSKIPPPPNLPGPPRSYVYFLFP